MYYIELSPTHNLYVISVAYVYCTESHYLFVIIVLYVHHTVSSSINLYIITVSILVKFIINNEGMSMSCLYFSIIIIINKFLLCVNNVKLYITNLCLIF